MVDKTNISHQWVTMDKLFVERAYQREHSQRQINEMVKGFNPLLLGVIVVSKRSTGSCSVIDGQHRFEASKIVGSKRMFCEVHEGLTVEEEAKLFKLLNKNRKRVTALEIYHADKVSGDKQAKDIETIVESIGCKIPRSKTGKLSETKNSIGAIGTMNQIYSRHGREALLLTLSLIKETWDKKGDAFRGSIIEGMSVFINRYQLDPVFSRKRFAEKLRWVDISTITSKARARKEIAGGNGAYHVADVLLEEYNKNLKAKMIKPSA